MLPTVPKAGCGDLKSRNFSDQQSPEFPHPSFPRGRGPQENRPAGQSGKYFSAWNVEFDLAAANVFPPIRAGGVNEK